MNARPAVRYPQQPKLGSSAYRISRPQVTQPVTLRHLVNAIPAHAIRQGTLTVERRARRTSPPAAPGDRGAARPEVDALPAVGRLGQRSAAACTVRLSEALIIEYMRFNIMLMRWMIASGYADRLTLERRIKSMESWIADLQLLAPDATPNTSRSSRSIWPTSTSRSSPARTIPTTSAAVGTLRRHDRRGVHRFVHDRYRPLPRRRQGAGRQVRHSDPAGIALPTRWTPCPDEEGYYKVLGKSGPAWRCWAVRCAWAIRRRSARA